FRERDCMPIPFFRQDFAADVFRARPALTLHLPSIRHNAANGIRAVAFKSFKDGKSVMRRFVPLLVAGWISAVLLFTWGTERSVGEERSAHDRSVGIDQLMGGHGRAEHAQRLAELKI